MWKISAVGLRVSNRSDFAHATIDCQTFPVQIPNLDPSCHSLALPAFFLAGLVLLTRNREDPFGGGANGPMAMGKAKDKFQEVWPLLFTTVPVLPRLCLDDYLCWILNAGWSSCIFKGACAHERAHRHTESSTVVKCNQAKPAGWKSARACIPEGRVWGAYHTINAYSFVPSSQKKLSTITAFPC